MSSDQGFFSDVRGPVVPGGGLGKLAWDHRDASLGALPVFTATDDPGPSFGALLSGVGRDWRSAWMPAASAAGSLQQGRDREFQAPHATTVLALRFKDGVVMAGDRRATEGSFIAHRLMEKVLPADRHSGVAIAGVAGPATEMVKLFQTQLEHYEKVEGAELSLEGKANQLGQMVRENLAMAMQGLVVVPLFAGYDLHRHVGRIFTYDVTGGHYEELDFHATGSGGRDARAAVKARWRWDLERSDAINLAVQALYDAVDEDAATGGPDAVRGIYPTVAVVTAAGFEKLGDEEVEQSFAEVIASKRESGRMP